MFGHNALKYCPMTIIPSALPYTKNLVSASTKPNALKSTTNAIINMHHIKTIKIIIIIIITTLIIKCMKVCQGA